MATTLGERAAEVDPTAHEFAHALGDLIRVIQFRDRDRAWCHDLSVTQCYALKGVVEAGGLTVNDLAAYLYLDKSTVSRVANGLAGKSLLEKRRDEDDRRVVRLVATHRGRTLHERIESELVAEYDELLEDFDPAFRSAIVKLIKRLRKSLRAGIEVSGGSCCIVGS